MSWSHRSKVLVSLSLLAACAPVPTASPVVALPPPAVVAACATSATSAGEGPRASRAEALEVKGGIPFFHGKVVHPGALRELGTSLADSGPIDVAVDLDGVQSSNRYYRPAVVRDHFVDFKDDELLGKDASFSYVFLGTTPGGISAFETYFSGGGSGTFMSVLLVRIEKQLERREDKQETRVVMRRVGEIGLGDRSRSEVTLVGGALKIGASGDRPEAKVIELE
jgi:hypothetical protein